MFYLFSDTLEVNYNIVDKENPIDLIMDIQIKNN